MGRRLTEEQAVLQALYHYLPAELWRHAVVSAENGVYTTESTYLEPVETVYITGNLAEEETEYDEN